MRELYKHDDIAFNEAIAHAALATLLEHPKWGEIWAIKRGDRPVEYRGQSIGTATLKFLRDRCVASQDTTP